MSAWTPGALAPQPGPAPLPRMLLAQTRAELTLVLRNGEQVLLSLVIPLGLLVLLVTVPFVDVNGQERADFFVPGVLALAVMSTAFTGQAIGVGFERQYGVLKRLGATPLPRALLLAAKTLAVLAVEVLQVTLICLTGVLLGGTLRGLTSLAAANLVWFVLLVLGGILFPLSAFGAAEPVLSLLPSAALSSGLREAVTAGGLPLQPLATLPVWAVGSLAAASRLFRWE